MTDTALRVMIEGTFGALSSQGLVSLDFNSVEGESEADEIHIHSIRASRRRWAGNTGVDLPYIDLSRVTSITGGNEISSVKLDSNAATISSSLVTVVTDPTNATVTSTLRKTLKRGFATGGMPDYRPGIQDGSGINFIAFNILHNRFISSMGFLTNSSVSYPLLNAGEGLVLNLPEIDWDSTHNHRAVAFWGLSITLEINSSIYVYRTHEVYLPQRYLGNICAIFNQVGSGLVVKVKDIELTLHYGDNNNASALNDQFFLALIKTLGTRTDIFLTTEREKTPLLFDTSKSIPNGLKIYKGPVTVNAIDDPHNFVKLYWENQFFPGQVDATTEFSAVKLPGAIRHILTNYIRSFNNFAQTDKSSKGTGDQLLTLKSSPIVIHRGEGIVLSPYYVGYGSNNVQGGSFKYFPAGAYSCYDIEIEFSYHPVAEPPEGGVSTHGHVWVS